MGVTTLVQVIYVRKVLTYTSFRLETNSQNSSVFSHSLTKVKPLKLSVTSRPRFVPEETVLF